MFMMGEGCPAFTDGLRDKGGRDMARRAWRERGRRAREGFGAAVGRPVGAEAEAALQPRWGGGRHRRHGIDNEGGLYSNFVVGKDKFKTPIDGGGNKYCCQGNRR